MYVRPDQRGKRIGQELLSALVAEARERNIHRIILDSHHHMTSAHRIYRAAGFIAPPDSGTSRRQRDFPSNSCPESYSWKWTLAEIIAPVDLHNVDVEVFRLLPPNALR